MKPGSSIELVVLVFAALWVLILLSVPVGVTMGITGLIGAAAILPSSASLVIPL